MLTLVIAVSVVVVAAISLVWWMGSRPEQPIVVRVVEAKEEVKIEGLPKAAKASGAAQKAKTVKASIKASKAAKAPKTKATSASSASSVLVCPYCKATAGRRGPFTTKAHLGAHVGRCKSKKK